MEKIRDLLRAAPLPAQAENLPLAIAQHIVGCRAALRFSADHLFRQLRRQRRARVEFSREDRADRFDDLAAGFTLHDIAVRTRAKRPLGDRDLVMGREHQQPDGGQLRARKSLISSKPEPRGRVRSTTTTSGCANGTAASAAEASSACPQISRSVSSAIMLASHSRTSGWSSTRNTRARRFANALDESFMRSTRPDGRRDPAMS